MTLSTFSIFSTLIHYWTLFSLLWNTFTQLYCPVKKISYGYRTCQGYYSGDIMLRWAVMLLVAIVLR